jgi:hypothetical protein
MDRRSRRLEGRETRGIGFLLPCLDQLWASVPSYKPLSVGVVLLDLVPAGQHQPHLIAADNGRLQKLWPLIDRHQRLLWSLLNRLRPVSRGRAGVQRPCRISPGAGEAGVLNRQSVALHFQRALIFTSTYCDAQVHSRHPNYPNALRSP